MRGAIKAEKERIRQEIRGIAARLTPEYRREASRDITRQVLALPVWQQAKTVMAFWSIDGEPDTRTLMETALAEGKNLLLPRCVDGTTLAALPVDSLAEVEPGLLGIPAPRITGRRVPVPELILVPCMAASPQGIRLGHGAGYYDRFLAGQHGTTVCLCFRRLLRPDLPAGERDVPVDLVISDGQEIGD